MFGIGDGREAERGRGKRKRGREMGIEMKETVVSKRAVTMGCSPYVTQ